MSGKSFIGQTALVTGASQRIGREIALSLAREGADVIVHFNHSEKEAQGVADEVTQLGVKAWILKADFKVRSEYEGVIQRAFQLAGRLDILVNNASIFPADDLKTLNFESVMLNMEVNAWVPFTLGRIFSEKVNQGKIINILDSRTSSYDWTHVGYILSKHVFTVLTKMSAVAYAPRVTVNGVAPGLILPPPGKPQSYLEERVHTVPLKRHGSPQDIVGAVIYLLKTSFVTGDVVYVDGGRHLKEYGDG